MRVSFSQETSSFPILGEAQKELLLSMYIFHKIKGGVLKDFEYNPLRFKKVLKYIDLDRAVEYEMIDLEKFSEKVIQSNLKGHTYDDIFPLINYSDSSIVDSNSHINYKQELDQFLDSHNIDFTDEDIKVYNKYIKKTEEFDLDVIITLDHFSQATQMKNRLSSIIKGLEKEREFILKSYKNISSKFIQIKSAKNPPEEFLYMMYTLFTQNEEDLKYYTKWLKWIKEFENPMYLLYKDFYNQIKLKVQDIKKNEIYPLIIELLKTLSKVKNIEMRFTGREDQSFNQGYVEPETIKKSIYRVDKRIEDLVIDIESKHIFRDEILKPTL